MNIRTNKTILLITLMICLATAVYSAVGTFTFRTSGASDTTEVVDLRYPQKVPEDSSVTTDSIADGSITNDKLAEPISVANGGTGKTTAAEGLAALGGASLNGSSTVAFNASTINGLGLFRQVFNKASPARGVATCTITHGDGPLCYTVDVGVFCSGALASGIATFKVGGNAANNAQMSVSTIKKVVTAGVVISDIERISASEVRFTITNSTGTSRTGCVVVTGQGGPFAASIL